VTISDRMADHRPVNRDRRSGVRRPLLRGLLTAVCAVVCSGPAASAASAVTVAPSGITAVEGSAFAGPVGTFTDSVPLTCPAPTTYSATVSWADQTTSVATIGPPSLSILSCTYPVSAGHTFGHAGTEPVRLAITGATGQETSAVGSATVTDAPLSATGAGLSGVAGTPVTATVATFGDADPNAGASLYTATIGWGDGTTTADPTITADPAGGFDVSGSHTYGRTGIFATAVTVSDAGGSSATATGTVSVGAPAPPPAPAPAAGSASPPPAAPPPAVPAPAPAPVPPLPIRPPVVGVSTPRLTRPAGLALRLTCPTTTPRCSGVARVVAAPARTQRAPVPSGASIGSALFLLRPGESKTITVPVARQLRGALRRARSARLAGVAIAFGAAGRHTAATGPSAVIKTSGLS
jgi:hypothetical protein